MDKKNILAKQKPKLQFNDNLSNNTKNDAVLSSQENDISIKNAVKNDTKIKFKEIDLTVSNEKEVSKKSVLDETWSECNFKLKDLPKLYAQLSKQNLTSTLPFSNYF